MENNRKATVVLNSGDRSEFTNFTAFYLATADDTLVISDSKGGTHIFAASDIAMAGWEMIPAQNVVSDSETDLLEMPLRPVFARA